MSTSWHKPQGVHLMLLIPYDWGAVERIADAWLVKTVSLLCRFVCECECECESVCESVCEVRARECVVCLTVCVCMCVCVSYCMLRDPCSLRLHSGLEHAMTDIFSTCRQMHHACVIMPMTQHVHMYMQHLKVPIGTTHGRSLLHGI